MAVSTGTSGRKYLWSHQLSRVMQAQMGQMDDAHLQAMRQGKFHKTAAQECIDSSDIQSCTSWMEIMSRLRCYSYHHGCSKLQLLHHAKRRAQAQQQGQRAHMRAASETRPAAAGLVPPAVVPAATAAAANNARATRRELCRSASAAASVHVAGSPQR